MAARAGAARGVQAVTQAVTLPALLELMESLSLLVRRGERPWQLDVVWESHDSPWYVAACRRRATELGLGAHVRFLGADGAGAGAAPTAGDRSVLLLEPMADRRRRRRSQATAAVGAARAVAVSRYRSMTTPPALSRIDELA